MRTFKLVMLMIIVITSISTIGYSQTTNEVRIGTISNGVLTISNDQYLIKYFKIRIGNDGSLGEYLFQYAPDKKTVLLSCPITENSKGVTCISLLLIVDQNIAYLTNEKSSLGDTGGGASVEVTCTGDPCNSCLVNVSSWYPFHAYCKCHQNTPPCTNCKCNMTTSTTVNINIGL